MRRRHHTRRRLCTPLLAVVLLGTAVGCSGDGEVASTPDTVGRPGADGDATYRATVHRTGNDVAHVESEDLGGVGFGQGWVAAEDHACTLADQVVSAAGARSRWFGPGPGDENVDSDVTMRAMGVPARGEEAVAELDDRAADLMAGYVAGVRAWYEGATAPDGPLDPEAGDGAEACPAVEVLADVSVAEVLSVQYRVALAGDLDVLTTMATASPDGGDGPEGDAPAADTDENAAGEDAAGEDAADEDAADEDEVPGPEVPAVPTPPGGTAWAVGSAASESGGGTLLALPLLDWEGGTRLWENHLRVPGELDVYGASFVGVPVPAVAFTEELAYSPVPSPSPRGSAFRLTMVPGDPTSHLVDEVPEALLSEEIPVEVLDEDGSLRTDRRTVWRSRFGTIVEPEGLAWTATSAVAWRDVALETPPLVSSLLDMATADDLAALRSALDGGGGPAWAATVATSADGVTWYGDTAATPALTDEQRNAYAAALASDLHVAVAATKGIVLLDGSVSSTGWIEDGAGEPVLAPLGQAAALERRDLVVGGGSGSWLPNPEAPIVDGAAIRGAQPRPLDPSHRQSLLSLRTAVEGAEGTGAGVSLGSLQTALLAEQDLTGTLLADAVVARCERTGVVEVPEERVDGRLVRPAREVDLGPACGALRGWDRTFILESRGSLLWRSFLARFDDSALTSAGALFEVPFREADPLGTPRALAPPPEEGPDPVMVALAQAASDLTADGIPLDAVLREVQWAQRGEERIPMHGGAPRAGSLTGVAVRPAPGGRRVVGGPSFVLAVTYTDRGPVGEALLAYGQSDRPDAPGYVDQTYRYSDRAWRPVQFDAEAISSDPALVTREVVGPRPTG